MSDASRRSRALEYERAKALCRPEEIGTREDFHHMLGSLIYASGLSHRELAEKLSMSPAAVGRYLRGTSLPRLEIFPLLLDTLGVPPSQLGEWHQALDRVRRLEPPPVSGTVEAEKEARRDLSEAEDELTAAQELTLPALWKVTHARLDYYHQIATGQARQSFRNAQIAMGVGFVLLVVFAVLALTAQSTAGAVVTGSLGAVSAAFAAYIGRTFVRSQETAAAHLRSYFDQPLEFSRYLAAERLLNSIERLETDQRATITADVLRGMLPTRSSNGADKPTGEA
jgi:transcriptional regulator with XRE-family HTH domain